MPDPQSVVELQPVCHPGGLGDLAADGRPAVVECRQAVHELDLRVLGRREQLRVDLVRELLAVLDGVEHPAEDACGVGDRFLVAHLGAGRVEVGDVGALVEGGDLEGAARAGRALLEDQAISLPARRWTSLPAYFAVSVPVRAREQVQELVAVEVDLFEEVAIAQVVHG